MDLNILLGAFIMTLAFLAYGIGSVTLERFRLVGTVVLAFLTIGLMLNITAILLMVWETDSVGISFHSIIGTVAFLVMAVNTAWSWYLYFRKGVDGSVSLRLVTYTKVAYFIWVTAYLLGMIIVIWA
jgi:hypothetical protein